MKRRSFLGTLLGACAALLPWRKAAPVDMADVVWPPASGKLGDHLTMLWYEDVETTWIIRMEWKDGAWRETAREKM